MYIIFIIIVVYMVQNGEQLIIGKNQYHQYQWQFQEPKLEVPTIYKAYFLGPINVAYKPVPHSLTRTVTGTAPTFFSHQTQVRPSGRAGRASTPQRCTSI